MHRTVYLCLGLWLTSCEADDPCDAEQTYKQGACIPGASDAGSKPTPQDAGETSYAHDGGTCSEDRSAVLGKTCAGQDGCNCAAPYCAIQPGQSAGYCTLHCRPSESDCPAGHRCFDLSALGVEGFEPFCIKN